VKLSVLVTGAGGFIGSHLCSDLVSKEYRVIGIDPRYRRNRMHGKQSGFLAVRGDFRNRELMKELLDGVDIIFHLAGAHLEINLPDSEYWSINVHSLRPLMELAHQSGVKRFVHVSSAGVYGNLKHWPADEETPCCPQNIYGQTKLAGETEVKKFREDTGLPAVILRPSWVYGPGCPRTRKIYRALRKGRFAMIGKGDNRRHPLYIRDMLSAFMLAMESNHAVGETFIIGGGQTVTTRELLDSFCRLLELPEIKIKLPMKLGELMASALETVFGMVQKEPPFSRRSLEFFNTTNAFDISKAKQLLGFYPAFTFEQGLKDCRAWLESRFGS